MDLLGRGRIPLGNNDGMVRGAPINLTLDGQGVVAYEGETIAAVIVVDEGLATREASSGEHRGIFCGIGVCFDCLVIVNGVPNTRACMTYVVEGMSVSRQTGRAARH
jgi:predicted molibdopterin-dependent oxidoreductase YjgC